MEKKLDRLIKPAASWSSWEDGVTTVSVFSTGAASAVRSRGLSKEKQLFSLVTQQ